MTVCVLNYIDNSYRRLYEFIETFEEAELLAQFAMRYKTPNEIVFIFPGSFRGYKDGEELRAERLSEKYKAKRPDEIYHGDNSNLELIKKRLHKMVDSL